MFKGKFLGSPSPSSTKRRTARTEMGGLEARSGGIDPQSHTRPGAPQKARQPTYPFAHIRLTRGVVPLLQLHPTGRCLAVSSSSPDPHPQHDHAPVPHPAAQPSVLGLLLPTASTRRVRRPAPGLDGRPETNHGLKFSKPDAASMAYIEMKFRRLTPPHGGREREAHTEGGPL